LMANEGKRTISYLACLFIFSAIQRISPLPVTGLQICRPMLNTCGF
jgi:hypothetical protein